MTKSIYLLFDPDKMIKELEKVKSTHPRLKDQSTISQIVFSETIAAVFTKEQYARIECKKLNENGQNYIILRRDINDPDRLLPPQKLSEKMYA